MALEQFKEEWQDMDPKWRSILIVICVVGVIAVSWSAIAHRDSGNPVPASEAPPAAAQSGQPGGTAGSPAFSLSVVPSTNRNQGLEDLKTELDVMRAENQQFKAKMESLATQHEGKKPEAFGAARGSTEAPSPVDLNAALPPVNFDLPPEKNGRESKGGGTLQAPAPTPAPAVPEVPRMKTWPADPVPAAAVSGKMDGWVPVIPVNSGMESVMLTGINARQAGAIAGAVGNPNSSNNVGAPFVTRVKGNAILPNGWKLSDLGDCFLGGSAVAVISAERAYATASTLSCIKANGEEWEAPVKAYAVDADGTLGISGKVVSKQGRALQLTALAGIASGLGTALSPTSLPSYNSNATSGSTQGVQYPNPSLVATTTVGQGLNQASSLLAKFYLDYAREIFPVVEVVAGTRVTWIVESTIELKKRERGQS